MVIIRCGQTGRCLVAWLRLPSSIVVCRVRSTAVSNRKKKRNEAQSEDHYINETIAVWRSCFAFIVPRSNLHTGMSQTHITESARTRA